MRLAHRLGCTAFAATSLVAAAPAHAGKATYPMRVSAAVINGCTVTANPLVFVLLTPTNLNVDSTTSVLVKCTPNIPFTIDIDSGLHNNGINRRVKSTSGNTFINYDVYRDPPRSQVWGVGQSKNIVGNSGILGTVIVPVYGRLASSARLAAGAYTDTLTVTLNF